MYCARRRRCHGGTDRRPPQKAREEPKPRRSRREEHSGCQRPTRSCQRVQTAAVPVGPETTDASKATLGFGTDGMAMARTGLAACTLRCMRPAVFFSSCRTIDPFPLGSPPSSHWTILPPPPCLHSVRFRPVFCPRSNPRHPLADVCIGSDRK